MSPITNTVTTLPATNTGLAANPIGYTVRAPKKVLQSDDFMKLLSTQMSNQDPLKPMEDTAFVSQMASFTSLAQAGQMASDITAMRADQAKVAAASYIGKSATVLDQMSQQTVTGEVTAVDTTSSEPRLQINGQYYGLSTLQRVEAYVPVATNTSP